MLAKEIKPGAVVNYEGAPILIQSVQVQTPSARGAATLYKYRGRNLVSRQKHDITLKGTESLLLPKYPCLSVSCGSCLSPQFTQLSECSFCFGQKKRRLLGERRQCTLDDSVQRRLFKAGTP